MLTKLQIKYLKTLAHPLSPVLQSGNKGLTDAFHEELAIALKSHELIKVKLNTERDERELMIAEITEKQRCEVIQYIGKTIVLFKRNSNNIKIELPKK